MIYVATSWKNPHQPRVVSLLQLFGHTVYDFRAPGAVFNWSEIDPAWQSWDGHDMRAGFLTDIAQRCFKRDMDALRASESCVLVYPCGRSAHLEAGWAVGAGRKVITYIPHGERGDPELMLLMTNTIVTSESELLAAGGW